VQESPQKEEIGHDFDNSGGVVDSHGSLVSSHALLGRGRGTVWVGAFGVVGVAFSDVVDHGSSG
jgi:hypothetical protein